MLRNYIKIAFRSLISNRLFTAVNVFGLAIGMASALLIFIWVQNELSFDRHHQDSEQIYRVLANLEVGDGEVWKWSTVPFPLKDLMLEEIPEIEESTLIKTSFESVIVELDNSDLFKVKNFAYVEPNWFDLFEYEVLEGSLSSFQNQVHTLALTEEMSEKYFGYRRAVGQQLIIDSTIYTVSAILANPPANSSFQFQVYAPFQAYLSGKKSLERLQKDWWNYQYMAFIKLKETANSEAIAEKITTIFDNNKEKNTTTTSLELLKDIRFNQSLQSDNLTHQSKAAVYIFAFIGLILLLTAALNYINLSTALIGKRVQEIGVKKIVGASFSHIFIQIIAETLLISMIAFVIAIGVAYICLPLLGSYLEIPLQLAFNKAQIWLVLFGLIIINILLSGIYPATLFAGFKPARLLKGIKTDREGISLRKILVITQFSITIVVLISTIVIHQQLQFIQNKDIGYDRSNVIEISPKLHQGNRANNFQRFALFEEELRKIPEFESIATTGNSIVNIRNANSGNFKWEGQNPDSEASVFVLSANEDLTTIFDLEMADGRWFLPERSEDVKNIIINEAAVRNFNIPKPVVGQKITFNGEGQIIGVVKDFNFQSPREQIQPLLINHNEGQSSILMARLNSSNTQTALAKAEQKFKEIFPELPFEYAFLDHTYQELHENEAKTSTLFKVFALLLIFISCLGLFGLATFNVERRTKEIGIRKVLGASVTGIMQLLSKDFLKLVFIALIIASPIAWYIMKHWLQDYAYHTDLQWWIFAAAGILTIGVALLTISSQSWRAALTDPTKSLRSE